MATETKRIKLSPITIHPESERLIRKVKNQRAISTGQALDILLRDLVAANRRLRKLEDTLHRVAHESAD